VVVSSSILQLTAAEMRQRAEREAGVSIKRKRRREKATMKSINKAVMLGSLVTEQGQSQPGADGTTML
jgi:hypothetical protein